jgi:ketosteroid isomerase-like protein
MKYVNLVFVSIISITPIGCSGESNSEMATEDARQAIEQVHELYIEAVLAEDVEAFLDTVTDDFGGKDAVRVWFNATFGAYSTVKLVFPTADVTIDRDWAFKQYTFDWTLDPKAGGDQVRDLGSGLYIYHLGDDGSWKVAYDIWNSSEPLTGTD